MGGPKNISRATPDPGEAASWERTTTTSKLTNSLPETYCTAVNAILRTDYVAGLSPRALWLCFITLSSLGAIIAAFFRAEVPGNFVNLAEHRLPRDLASVVELLTARKLPLSTLPTLHFKEPQTLGLTELCNSIPWVPHPHVCGSQSRWGRCTSLHIRRARGLVQRTISWKKQDPQR